MRRFVYLFGLCCCLSVTAQAARKHRPKAKSSSKPVLAKPSSKQNTVSVTPQIRYIIKLTPLLKEAKSQADGMELIPMLNLSYAQMMNLIGAQRGTMAKIRTISPVPKSFARADKMLGQWTLMVDGALDSLKIYAGDRNQHDALSDYFTKYADAKTFSQSFVDEFRRQQEPVVPNKSYVKG